MNNPYLGGRGKKAPYASELYRIPTPLKPIVQQLANQYRDLVQTYPGPNSEGLLTETLKAVAIGSFEMKASEATNIQQAKEVLINALRLKANAGGAIKEEIRKALTLLG